MRKVLSMKLADWARKQGIDYQTAYRWFRDGNLPMPAIQLPTGTILVGDEVKEIVESDLKRENEELKKRLTELEANGK